MVLIACRKGKVGPEIPSLRFYAQLSWIFTLYGKGRAGSLVSTSSLFLKITPLFNLLNGQTPFVRVQGVCSWKADKTLSQC